MSERLPAQDMVQAQVSIAYLEQIYQMTGDPADLLELNNAKQQLHTDIDTYGGVDNINGFLEENDPRHAKLRS